MLFAVNQMNTKDPLEDSKTPDGRRWNSSITTRGKKQTSTVLRHRNARRVEADSIHRPDTRILTAPHPHFTNTENDEQSEFLKITQGARIPCLLTFHRELLPSKRSPC